MSALGPIRASQSHRPRYPRQPLALGPGNIPWKMLSHQRRCAGAHSPPRLTSPGGRSQPACSPGWRGESPRPQTGHMDNHLRLITRLCQRDGPQTSGSDKPPLLPPPLPEMFYQMLQEKIQAVQHEPGCWSVTQLSRLTPGSRSTPVEEM